MKVQVGLGQYVYVRTLYSIHGCVTNYSSNFAASKLTKFGACTTKPFEFRSNQLGF